MKLKRNGIAMTALVLSAAVFFTTALADTLIGSGYDSLKNSIKSTSAEMENGFDNFTFEAIYTIKDNGNKIMEHSEVVKADNKNKAYEKITNASMQNGKVTTNYLYNDEQVRITKNNQDDKYYVSDLKGDDRSYNNAMVPNPFKEERFSDVEKIIDAAVGGLKDSVQVEENSAGGNTYTGSITQTQVPALINAIASFGFKQMFMDSGYREETYKMPQIKSDIFIKSVSGKATEDENGHVNSINGEIVFSGNDEKGVTHNISVDILLNLKDINSTEVTKLDLTGKTVEKVASNGMYIDSQYEGNYKNNIVIEQNGKFVKIGERLLTITHINDKTINGNYAETYKPGYENYFEERLAFDFEVKSEDNHSQFMYKNFKGEIEYGTLNTNGHGNIYLSLHQAAVEIREDGGASIKSIRYDKDFNNAFERVFED